MIDVHARRDRAGRSASRRYREVARTWRRRRFGGRKAPYLFFIAIFVVLLVLPAFHMSSRLSLFVGTVFGMLVVGVRMLPEALMPGHISNWQMGAWGEVMTARELKDLPSREWLVRHDVRWGKKWNHDHVVAGRGVYVLNTKYVKDSRIELEGDRIRIRRLDDPEDGYLADRWVASLAKEADSLRYELGRALGFWPHVYPVIVLWGEFDPEPRWVSDVTVKSGYSFDVAILNGNSLTQWLTSRPADLSAEQQRAVSDYVRSMARA